MQVFEIFETKLGLQGLQLMASEILLLGMQVMHSPVYCLQLAQLIPHVRQVLLVLFKYYPVGHSASNMHVLSVVL